METQGEMKKVERRVDAAHKLAMSRWIPISTDPIDRFTPEFLKENLPVEKWPVVLIRKPGTLDMLKLAEQIPAKEREAAEAMAKQASGVTGEAPVAVKDGKITGEFLVSLGKAAIETWRERVAGFENVFAADGQLLKYSEENGRISDRCLNMIPLMLFIAVHLRYDELFRLSDLEKEGLDSRPASA